MIVKRNKLASQLYPPSHNTTGMPLDKRLNLSLPPRSGWAQEASSKEASFNVRESMTTLNPAYNLGHVALFD